MSRPLYVVLHIYKTAGKSLLRDFKHNFRQGQLLQMYAPQIGLNKAECSANPGWDEVTVLAYLSEHYTPKVQCIFGHMAFYGIHELDRFSDRDVRYIIFLREPVARIVSLYNFLRFNSRNAWHHEIITNNWSLSEWFERSRGLWLHDGQIRQLLLWQSKDVLELRQLQSDHLLMAQKVLEQMWFIGDQAHFQADTERLYAALGFTKTTMDERVNVSRGDIAPDQDTADRIAADNILDDMLYRYALDLRAQRPPISSDITANDSESSWLRRLTDMLPFQSLSS